MQECPKYPNRLYTWIKQRGYQLYEVAREVNIPQRTLHNYCKGRTPIPRYRLEALARFLECPIAALIDEPVPPDTAAQGPLRGPARPSEQTGQKNGTAFARAQHAERPLHEQRNASMENGTEPPPMPTHHSSSFLASLLGLSTPLAILTSRRQLFQEMLAVAGIALLTPPYELLNGDALERAAYAVHKPIRLDTHVISDLGSITAHYWRMLSHGATLPDLLPGVAGHFCTVLHFFKHSQTMNIRRDLSVVTQDAAQLIGHIFANLHDLPSAWSYYTLARTAGQSAAQLDNEAALLFRTSFLFTDDFEAPSEALTVLEQAQHLTRHSIMPGLRARLAARKAEVHATLEQQDACFRELDTTEDLIESLDGQTSAVPDQATHFDRALFASYKGACLLRLDNPQGALASLGEAHDVLHIESCHDAVFLAHLSIAHAQLGAYEQACRLGREALVQIAQRKSTSDFYRVQVLQKNLVPWTHTPEVKEFEHQLEVVRASLQNEKET